MDFRRILNSSGLERGGQPGPAAHSPLLWLFESLENVRSSSTWVHNFGPRIGNEFITELNKCSNAVGNICQIDVGSVGESALSALGQVSDIIREIERCSHEQTTQEEMSALLDRLNIDIGHLSDCLYIPRAQLALGPTLAQQQRQQQREDWLATERRTDTHGDAAISNRLEKLKELNPIISELEGLYAQRKSQLDLWRAPRGETTAEAFLAEIALALRQIREEGMLNIPTRTVKVDLDAVLEDTIEAIKPALDYIASWTAHTQDGSALSETLAFRLKQKFNVLIKNTKRLNKALNPKDPKSISIPAMLGDNYSNSNNVAKAEAEAHFGRWGTMSERRAAIYQLL